jgi:dephospho-CoA kinase
MTPRHRLIGLTGTNGAGKGVVAEFFEARGYGHHSLSDAIRDELRREGVLETRDALIAKGNELRRAFGPDVLARRTLAKVAGPAVIDSIRNPFEVAALREQPGFILMALDAPAALRYERVAKRGRNECAACLEEFVRKEEQEKGTDPAAQQLHTCMALADRILVNDASIEDLHRRLEEFL